MRAILTKNKLETQDFRKEQFQRRKALYEKHRNSVEEVYSKYHGGQVPDDHFLRLLENRRFQEGDEL